MKMCGRRWTRRMAAVLLILSLHDLHSEESKASSEGSPVPGQVSKIPFAPLDSSLPVWIPEGHEEDDKRRWPVLLYYHGTNGNPTLRFAMDAAGQEDWILIGMSYREKGRFSYQPDNLRAEIEVYNELLETWNERFSLRLDPRRVYVGGFSKGGWVSALFLEEDPRLAGAVILGAGHLGRADFDPAQFSLDGKPVYIGLGESDGNVGMSFRAKEVYEAAGARVTWEFWSNLGHTLPRKCTPSLHQWFRIEGQLDGSHEIESKAIQWLEAEWSKAEVLENRVEQWTAVEEIKEAPWFRFADREILSEIREWEESWLRSEGSEEELAAKERYFSTLEAESKNRYVETLREAKERYHRLASEYPRTYWGARAAKARDRCAALLPK